MLVYKSIKWYCPSSHQRMPYKQRFLSVPRSRTKYYGDDFFIAAPKTLEFSFSNNPILLNYCNVYGNSSCFHLSIIASSAQVISFESLLPRVSLSLCVILFTFPCVCVCLCALNHLGSAVLGLLCYIIKVELSWWGNKHWHHTRAIRPVSVCLSFRPCFTMVSTTLTLWRLLQRGTLLLGVSTCLPVLPGDSCWGK